MKHFIIQVCSGITHGRVLIGKLYAQRLQKLIYLHLFTDCFMKISLQSSQQISLCRRLEHFMHISWLFTFIVCIWVLCDAAENLWTYVMSDNSFESVHTMIAIIPDSLWFYLASILYKRSAYHGKTSQNMICLEGHIILVSYFYLKPTNTALEGRTTSCSMSYSV